MQGVFFLHENGAHKKIDFFIVSHPGMRVAYDVHIG